MQFLGGMMQEAQFALSSLAPMIYTSTAIVAAFLVCQVVGLDLYKRFSEIAVRFAARNRTSKTRA
ncbi:MAG: hypothetical protein AB1428_14535 [Bacteroidota bacterium]